MIRFSRWFALALVAGWCLLNGDSVLADESGASAGLTTLWQSQVMIDGERDQIAEIHLHVHDDRADSYFELTYPGFRETVSFDDMNPRGIVFRDLYPEEPAKGAREWAELKKEILEARGKTDVSIELITVPRTTLYALTGTGGVHAIDGETGQTRWKTRVGEQFDPTIGIASNNTRVVVVRGSKVYCLNALTGDVVWSKFSIYAPGGGVSISDHFAYVTSIEGRLQMFPLNGIGLPIAHFASAGAATNDPFVTPRTVSWPTERGYFNVARSNVASLRYRLETKDKFQSAGTAVGEFLIANSVHGKVYALAEEYGSLAWEFAAGERLVKQPIGIGGDAVMIITANDNLIALDAKRGSVLAGWPKRVTGISEFVGASQNILYFIDSFGGLVGLSRTSGATISSTEIGLNVMSVPNRMTDRLYLAEPGGAVVCLRESANINPVVLGDDFVVGNEAAEAEQTMPDGSGDAAKPGDMQQGDPDDPFGGAAKSDPDDPFSGGADPDDPFAPGKKSDDEDDPFSNNDKSDDKSGDEDDPFGGGQ